MKEARSRRAKQMSTKSFASTGDLGPKKVSFDQLGEGLYAYTAEGDPNTGIIVGDEACAVIDAQATPAMAQDVIARIRQVTINQRGEQVMEQETTVFLKRRPVLVANANARS